MHRQKRIESAKNRLYGSVADDGKIDREKSNIKIYNNDMSGGDDTVNIKS